MEDWLDASAPPRAGEELDLDKLTAYLHDHLEGAEGEAARNGGGALTVEQFPSGFSNLTYLLRLGELELVLRRPPFGNRVRSAHDMGREYRVLAALHPVYPLAPRPYLYCDDEEVLGAPFYVMERRHGIILRRWLPAGLELTPILAGRLCERFIDHLADLHTLDVGAIELTDLDRGEGYIERQVSGWSKRYQKSQTDSWPEIDQVAAWLHENQPADSRHALIHNDYKYDNVVLDANDLTRIIAVLDWEMCTVGDPLLDLGTTLAYWTEASDDRQWQAAGFGPTAVAGSLTRRQLVEHYSRRTGLDISNLSFYFCFGLFKLAVIVQQIYYRFFKGHTKDPRFAQLNQMVGLLGRVAASSIESGRV